jgi:hypothetical protein
MPEKMMRVEWEDGADLSQSRKKPGGYSPLTRDENNNLGHVTLHDVDEDDGETDPEPVYVYVTDEDGSDGQAEEEGSLLAALAVLGVVVAAQKAAPHLKRWWHGQAVPYLKKSRDELRENRRSRGRVADAESTALAPSVSREQSQEVLAALDDYRSNMSSAEAQERFVAAVAARLFSDEQLRMLRSARIDDAEPASAVASALETLTPEQLAESIALMIESKSSAPHDEVLAELKTILDQTSRGDAEYVPVTSARIHKALGSARGPE